MVMCLKKTLIRAVTMLKYSVTKVVSLTSSQPKFLFKQILEILNEQFYLMVIFLFVFYVVRNKSVNLNAYSKISRSFLEYISVTIRRPT